MTGIGIQIVLPFIGIRSAFAHHEIMVMLELLHILGNSYRLASCGDGSGVVYGWFTLSFCRTVVALTISNRIASLPSYPTRRGGRTAAFPFAIAGGRDSGHKASASLFTRGQHRLTTETP